MGWASGSFVANALWDGLKDLIPLEELEEAAKVIVNTLEAHDWDTLDEAPDLMKAAYGPKWGERC